MSKKDNIGEEWRVRVRTAWKRDVTDLNREWSGVQGNRLHRFTTGLGGAQVQSPDEKETNDGDWYEFYLEQMTEDYRRSYERLAQTIHEAETAFLLALEGVQQRKEEAALRLEHIRAKALVLSDGRRVYFTRDGSELYDDDANEITDDETIEEAREARVGNPNASTHEDHKAETENLRRADELEDELFDRLREMEELKRRMEAGELTKDELDRITEVIVEGMSPEVRQLFEEFHGGEGDEDMTQVKDRAVSSQYAFDRAGRGDSPSHEEPSPPKRDISLDFQS